jgi:hypothetical protein
VVLDQAGKRIGFTHPWSSKRNLRRGGGFLYSLNSKGIGNMVLPPSAL